MAYIWQIEIDVPLGGNNPSVAGVLMGTKDGSAWEEQGTVRIKTTGEERCIGAENDYTPVDLPAFGNNTLVVWGEYKQAPAEDAGGLPWYRSAIVGWNDLDPLTVVSEDNPMYRDHCLEVVFRDDIEKADKDPNTANLRLFILTEFGTGDVRVVSMDRPEPR